MASDGAEGPIDQLWQTLVETERDYFRSRVAFVQAAKSGADVVPILRQALDRPADRGSALRILPILDESIKREVFQSLVFVASWAHKYLLAARNVILEMDRQWVLEHIPHAIEQVLRKDATYDEYRRFAELLDQLQSPYLQALVERAAASDDYDIHEVADDFRERARLLVGGTGASE